MSQPGLPPNLVSIEQALAALPVRKGRRWLVRFVLKTKFELIFEKSYFTICPGGQLA